MKGSWLESSPYCCFSFLETRSQIGCLSRSGSCSRRSVSLKNTLMIPSRKMSFCYLELSACFLSSSRNLWRSASFWAFCRYLTFSQVRIGIRSCYWTSCTASSCYWSCPIARCLGKSGSSYVIGMSPGSDYSWIFDIWCIEVNLLHHQRSSDGYRSTTNCNYHTADTARTTPAICRCSHEKILRSCVSPENLR